MKKLLNLEEKNLELKIRREVIKYASTIPEELRQFCNNFQKKDIQAINEFKQKINDNSTLKEFLKRSEIIYKYNFVESDCKYKDIIFKLFKPDRIYKNNAKMLSDKTGFFSMAIIYIVINYIDDNIPVTINRAFSQEEKELIKFLLLKGSEKDYIERYKKSKKELNSYKKSICDNLNSVDINRALNLVLIEKYFRQENSKFLNKIKGIN